MNRKLLALNLLLAATAIFAGFQLHNQWAAAKAREAARLNQKAAPLPPPPVPALPRQPVLQPSSYIGIAHQDLFDKSRNPDVPVEVPPPPPPPREPPPLPSYYGMMDIGDGKIAIMSANNSNREQEVRAGEMIGDFKLLDFDPKEIALEWDGRTFHKRTDEASQKKGGGDSSTAAANNDAGVMVSPPGGARAAQPAPTGTDSGPGSDIGMAGGTRPCSPTDTSANGTVKDGYVKVVIPGLFGKTCYWQPAGK